MRDEMYKKIDKITSYLFKANDMIYELGEIVRECDFDEEHFDYIKLMINYAENELNDTIESLDRLNVRDENGNVFI